MPIKTLDAASLRGRFPAPQQQQGPPDLKRPEQPYGASVFLTLPVPPSVNNLFTTWKDGSRHKSKEAVEYRDTVARRLLIQPHTMFQGQVGVRIRVYRKRKVGDIDNYKKALYDSLKGHCWRDDSQIIYEEAFRYDDPANPRVEVEIWEVARE
ncbi:RusA family crossover junction endodeoxyribonuclease [bacterium]|nr:MAG: RusA family crossover junction endodeoxyribonuclease [bacterium]